MNAPDFAGASREVLSFLHQRIGMDLWMVSRADNEDWVVLAAEDHGYGVKQGDVGFVVVDEPEQEEGP